VTNSQHQQSIRAAQKERNCKTSSPIQHFATAGAGRVESRIRKRSSEIKKKEYFADLIVILGIKYTEFTGMPFKIDLL
jgi:hypothetical protein